VCGIAGAWGTENTFSREQLETMTARLGHRGPDATGTFTEGPVYLGHTRLSILDVSDAANQPFHSACGRYVLSYNGEVYNYRELAAELGIQCSTTSDTEVVVEAFRRLGPGFVSRLDGMFAFAIFDRSDRKLYLFRDQVGIKPLYYGRIDGVFLFASELKAIVAACQRTSLTLRRESIVEYLALGFVPAPHSIYQQISKLPAGSWGVFEGSELQVVRYWSPEESVSSDVVTDERQALASLRNVLTHSVRGCLQTDVPFGTFLSGGIDSSLITALAQSLSPRPIQSFSIGFEEERWDEAPFSRKIAEHLGTQHQEFRLTQNEALGLLPQITEVYDEPFADSSAAPTMLLSRMARQSVTVTLSGDGGDELFLGYGAHQWANRFSAAGFWQVRRLFAAILKLFPDRYKRVASLLEAPDRQTLCQHIFSQEQYLFSATELKQLLTAAFANISSTVPATLSTDRQLRADERQAMFDLRYYLPDDLLTKVDRASMAYSLETRVPLLSARVIELAVNIAPELKRKGGTSKYLLRKLLEELVPRQLFDRPKRGFSVPLGRWLKSELAYLEHEYLSERVVTSCGVVQWAGVKSLRRRFHNGHSRLYNRIWLLIVLHKWLVERELRADFEAVPVGTELLA
jgi:asparagine synthase (glutamine-hydrolysing)